VDGTERYLRPAPWNVIIVEFVLGVMMLVFAALKAVLRSDSTAALGVAGFGAVGGMALGLALGMVRQRLASDASHGAR